MLLRYIPVLQYLKYRGVYFVKQAEKMTAAVRSKIASPLFISLLFLSLICCVTLRLSYASDVPPDEPVKSDVVDLEEEEFDDYIKKYSSVLVMFYANHCGICRGLKPHYESAATQLTSLGFPNRLARVDGTENSELLTRFKIKGYPTIKLFQGSTIVDYNSGRTATDIVRWFRRMDGEPVQIINNEDEIVSEGVDTYFLCKVKSADSDLYKMFSVEAEANRAISAFFAVISEQVEKESIHVFKTDEELIHFSGTTAEELKNFIEAEKFPSLTVLHPGNFESSMNRGLDFVWLDSTKEDYERYGGALRQASQSFRGKYNFVWVNSDLYGASDDKKEELPRLLINRLNNQRFSMTDVKEKLADANAIVDFINKVDAGEIERFLKSEPIPEKNDGAVKIVVAKTFNNMVFNNEKDVLLEIYAPWCGYCKAFEPTYQKLGEAYESDNGIIIAKMDGSSNESPDPKFEWSGFPTLFFLKAGETVPEVVDAERTLQGLQQYIGSRRTTFPTSEKVADEL